MTKIIEAEARIKEVCAYFYDGDKNDLQEFLNYINTKLCCFELILNREDNEISVHNRAKKKTYNTIHFIKNQYIIIYSKNYTIDSIEFDVIDEKTFDKLYSKKKAIDIK